MNQNNLVIDEKSLDTIFQEDFNFKGSVVCQKSVLIKGNFEGTLEVKENLFLGPSGTIEGNLLANSLTIQGKCKGDVLLKNHFALHQTGSFKGNIKASSLEVLSGASFNGSFHMEKEEAKNEI